MRTSTPLADTSENKPDTPSSPRTREVRVALVLYGGVSLAVYINGTTREFYDLVRGRGVWGLIQELAGVDVTVDVISGASAGGINGLFLAYALCGEKEFTPLEDLWRDRGGLQRLIRRADDEKARSLLDSAYMDRELQQAFRAMDRTWSKRHQEPGSGESRKKNRNEAPGLGSTEPPRELDCFLAVTDFDGRRETVGDFRSRPIEVKSHAARLHVKHRRGRWEPLAGPPRNGEERKEEALSPEILASFARATSAFPVAFEPVFLRGEEVGKFFDHRGRYLEDGESAVFIDGGVLDNKPFTPLLPTIYQRHANRPVERLLFFVEPDPPAVGPGHTAREAKDTKHESDGPNFFQVALASLSSLPAYESIADDLKALDRHNRRLDLLKVVYGSADGWLSQWDPFARDQEESRLALAVPLEPDEGSSSDKPQDEEMDRDDEIYRRARLHHFMENLARELPPSALETLTQQELNGTEGHDRQEDFSDLFEHLYSTRFRWIRNTNTFPDPLDDLDVDFHKRACFYWIYALHGLLERLMAEFEEVGDDTSAMRRPLSDGSQVPIRAQIESLQGALEILSKQVDMLLILESEALRSVRAAATGYANLRREEGSKSPGKGVWQWDASLLDVLQDSWLQPLRTAGVEDLVDVEPDVSNGQESVDAFSRAVKQTSATSFREQSLLAEHRRVLDETMSRFAGLDPEGRHSATAVFRRIDRRRYPSLLLSGLGEMDRIEYCRISARDSVRVEGSDTALGRWDDEPMSKVNGLQLGHFGAFLKRSWRSNDIMWGRQDAATVLFDTLLLKNGGKLKLSRWRARHLLADRDRLTRLGGPEELVEWLEEFAANDTEHPEAYRKLLAIHQREIYRDGLCTVLADAAHEEFARGRPKYDLSPPRTVEKLAQAGGTPHERFQETLIQVLHQFGGRCQDPLLRKITEATLPSRSNLDLDRFFVEHYQVGEERVRDLDRIDLTTLGLHGTRVLSNMTRRLLPREGLWDRVNKTVLGRATLGLTTLHLAFRSIRTGLFPILWLATLLASLVLLAIALFGGETIPVAWLVPALLLVVLLIVPGVWFGPLREVRWIGLVFLVSTAVALLVFGFDHVQERLGGLGEGLRPLLGWIASAWSWLTGGVGGRVSRWLDRFGGELVRLLGVLALGSAATWVGLRWRSLKARLGSSWRRIWSKVHAEEPRRQRRLHASTAELHALERRLSGLQAEARVVETLRQKVRKRVNSTADRVAEDRAETSGRRRAWPFRLWRWIRHRRSDR